MRYTKIDRYIILIDSIRCLIHNQAGSPDPASNFEGQCIRNQIIINYLDGPMYIMDFATKEESQAAFELLYNILQSN